jgi:hypothetical protein
MDIVETPTLTIPEEALKVAIEAIVVSDEVRRMIREEIQAVIDENYYPKNEIDEMVAERNTRLSSVEQQLVDSHANNEELVNRFGLHVQGNIAELKTAVNDTLRGFADSQAGQQRIIDGVIATQRETNRQVELILQTVEAWKPINETNQRQFQDVNQRMGKIEQRQGDIEAEERDAAEERHEINRRFELVTTTTGQIKSQMTTVSDNILTTSGQLKVVTEYMQSEQRRREVSRRRWEYIKKTFTSKPVIGILYPLATPLLGWIGFQIGDQLKLQEFVQAVISFLEHITSSL